jgi:hypothetical protein
LVVWFVFKFFIRKKQDVISKTEPIQDTPCEVKHKKNKKSKKEKKSKTLEKISKKTVKT